MVWLISGHQKVMDLLIIHFKVAHLYVAFALKYINSNSKSLKWERNLNQFIYWIV